jgi:hypothetical protein
MVSRVFLKHIVPKERITGRLGQRTPHPQKAQETRRMKEGKKHSNWSCGWEVLVEKEAGLLLGASLFHLNHSIKERPDSPW